MVDRMIEVPDWKDRAEFEAWYLANVRQMNLMAITPPPDPHDPETVLNPEWYRIVDHIDRWKRKHGL